nr:hypothetical protein [Tanacetum cinerariifolium]
MLQGAEPGAAVFAAQWRPASEFSDEEGRCLHREHARQAADAMLAAGQARLVKLRN